MISYPSTTNAVARPDAKEVRTCILNTRNKFSVISHSHSITYIIFRVKGQWRTNSILCQKQCRCFVLLEHKLCCPAIIKSLNHTYWFFKLISINSRQSIITRIPFSLLWRIRRRLCKEHRVLFRINQQALPTKKKKACPINRHSTEKRNYAWWQIKQLLRYTRLKKKKCYTNTIEKSSKAE